MKLRASPADGGLIIKDRYYHLKKYHSSFVGELIISQMKSDKKPNVTLCIIYVSWEASAGPNSGWGDCVMLLVAITVFLWVLISCVPANCWEKLTKNSVAFLCFLGVQVRSGVLTS